MNFPEKKYPRPDDDLGPVEKDPATTPEDSFAAESLLRIIESKAANDKKGLQDSEAAFELVKGKIIFSKRKQEAEALSRDRALHPKRAAGKKRAFGNQKAFVGDGIGLREGVRKEGGYILVDDTVSLGDLTDALLDTRKSTTIVVEKGSPAEIFYRILASELGIVMHDNAHLSKGGEARKDVVLFEVLPFSVDRKVIPNLFLNRVIQFLKAPRDLLLQPDGRRFGKRIEEEGLLPKGATERFYAALHERLMRKAAQSNTHEGRLLAEAYRVRLEQDGAAPMTEGELLALFRKEVDRALEQFRKESGQKGP